MEEYNFEVVKTILMEYNIGILTRKDTIDVELRKIIKEEYPTLDLKILELERKVNQKLRLLDKIKHSRERKLELLELNNLRIKKTKLLTEKNNRIDALLEEKELLAYNEYKYEKRISEIYHATTWEELNITEEEKEIINSTLTTKDDEFHK